MFYLAEIFDVFLKKRVTIGAEDILSYFKKNYLTVPRHSISHTCASAYIAEFNLRLEGDLSYLPKVIRLAKEIGDTPEKNYILLRVADFLIQCDDLSRAQSLAYEMETPELIINVLIQILKKEIDEEKVDEASDRTDEIIHVIESIEDTEKRDLARSSFNHTVLSIKPIQLEYKYRVVRTIENSDFLLSELIDITGECLDHSCQSSLAFEVMSHALKVYYSIDKITLSKKDLYVILKRCIETGMLKEALRIKDEIQDPKYKDLALEDIAHYVSQQEDYQDQTFNIIDQITRKHRKVSTFIKVYPSLRNDILRETCLEKALENCISISDHFYKSWLMVHILLLLDRERPEFSIATREILNKCLTDTSL